MYNYLVEFSGNKVPSSFKCLNLKNAMRNSRDRDYIMFQ